MSIFGAGPQFWEGIAGFTRKMLSPYLRKMPARVQSVQGTAPNQTAVVARADELAALAAGEISGIARPPYPVWGSVVVGQQVWCLVDGAGLHVMGTPGGGGGSTSDLLGAKNAAEALSTYPEGNTIAFGDATTTGWPATHVLVVTDNRTPFRNHQVIVEQPSGRTWRRVWDPALASGAGAWTAFGELPGAADKAKLDGLTQGAWIASTLLNGWVNYGLGYGEVAYRKEPFGVVRLRGVASGGAKGIATPIFVLPIGFRPAAALMMPGENNGPYATVDIQPSGNIAIYGGASNVRISFDAVIFPV